MNTVPESCLNELPATGARVNRVWLWKSILPGLLAGAGVIAVQALAGSASSSPRAEWAFLAAVAGLVWLGRCTAGIAAGCPRGTSWSYAGVYAAWLTVLLVLNIALFNALTWHKCLKFPLQ